MKHGELLHILGFLLLLSFSLPGWAEVNLSDQEYQEITQIMDQLEILMNEQDMTIEKLRKTNEDLQTLSESKQQKLNEQQITIETQQTLLKEEKKSSILITILSSIISGIVFFFTGAILL